MKLMSRFSFLVCAAFLGFAILSIAVPTQVRAAEEQEEIYRDNTDFSKALTKLGRGIVNVLTGWVEIPKNIATEWRRTDPFSGFVVGTIKGIGWTIGRTISGAYDIITFPVPVPKEYKPLMEPEYILPSVWGESLPIFRDDYEAGMRAGGQRPTGGGQYSTASGNTYGANNALAVADRSSTNP